jgi:DNA-binding PadR family transcriptional regulator
MTISKLEKKGLLEQFDRWSDKLGFGATVLDSGFSPPQLGYLAKLGLVELLIHPGNGYRGGPAVQSGAVRLYSLTPLGRAVLSRIAKSTPTSGLEAGDHPQ